MVVNLFQDLSCMQLIDFLFWSGLGMGRLPLLQITLPYWRQGLSLHRPGKQIIGTIQTSLYGDKEVRYDDNSSLSLRVLEASNVGKYAGRSFLKACEVEDAFRFRYEH